MRDKAIKVAGWPDRVVTQLMSSEHLANSWEILNWALGQQLIGKPWDPLPTYEDNAESTIIPSEVEGLGGYYVNPSTLAMPLFSTGRDHTFWSINPNGTPCLVTTNVECTFKPIDDGWSNIPKPLVALCRVKSRLVVS